MNRMIGIIKTGVISRLAAIKKINTVLFFAVTLFVFFLVSVPGPSASTTNITGGFNSMPAPVTDFEDVAVQAEDALTPDLNDPEWARIYNGGNDDEACAVATDSSSNAYVTGWSNNGTDYDARTIKYDPSGNVVWTVSYSYGSGYYDSGNGIAEDGSGYVYVAGDSCNDTICLCHISKYNSSGGLVWRKTYTGSYATRADGVKVDGSGNVYVAGGHRSNSTAEPDVLLLKYNSSGTLLWSRTYDRGYGLFDFASALALDGSGNIYVAVNSYNGTDDDYVTLKYNASGTRQWTKVYTNGGWEYSLGIAADSGGNIYVTGSAGTIKYNSSGVQVSWPLGEAALAAAVDSYNNVYITGSSNNGYLTTKYGATGNVIWTRTFNWGWYDYPNGIAVNADGTVYVSGMSYDVSTGYDYLTIKYNDSLRVITTALPSGMVGVPYSQTLIASGGLPQYTWSVIAGSLPGGLVLNSSAGEISGTLTAAGNFSFTLQVRDSNGRTSTQALSISIFNPLTITNSSLPPEMAGIAYRQTLIATGGASPYTWSIISGPLPGGLSLNTSTGEISGTPAISGTFNFTVQVTDAASPPNITTRPLSITIYGPLTIVTPSLPDGTVGAVYTRTLEASGGLASYSWAIIEGSLPNGLTLNSSGVISGSSMSAGTFNFTVQVSDSDSHTATKDFSITLTNLNLPVRIPGVHPIYYSSVLAAYKDLTDGEDIEAWAFTIAEDIDFDRAISVVLKGGYDTEFINNPLYTSIHGKITVSNGTVTIENIVLE